jgi:hypothetical protein
MYARGWKEKLPERVAGMASKVGRYSSIVNKINPVCKHVMGIPSHLSSANCHLYSVGLQERVL